MTDATLRPAAEIERALDHMGEGGTPERRVLQPRLVVRESTRAPVKGTSARAGSRL